MNILQIENNQLEEALLHLQNIGLDLNEYKKTRKHVSVNTYEELLDYTIKFVRAAMEYEKATNEAFDEVDKHLAKRRG